MTRRGMLAAPRGRRAGADRAIAIRAEPLDQDGAPVCARHEIVYSRYVITTFHKKDATDEVPEDSIVVFSARAVAPAAACDGRLARPPTEYLARRPVQPLWRYLAAGH